MNFDPKTHAALIQALGIQDLDAEKQQQILERTGAVIYQSIVTRAMEEMTDEQADEFEKMLEGEATPESVLAFFQANIPGFDQMIDEEAKHYLEGAQAPAAIE